MSGYLNKAFYFLLVGIVAFAGGAYFGRCKNTSSNTTENNTKRVTTIVKETGKETTTIVEDIKTKEKQTAQVESKRTRVSVQALIGTDVTNRFQPVYGAAVSKEVLGQITIGAFGLTNGTLGVSLGLNF